MEINEYGAFIGYKKLELAKKIPKGWDNYSEGITLYYGQYHGLWGFSTGYFISTEGRGSNLSESKTIYPSKNDMLVAARAEIVELCNEHFKGNLMFMKEHLDYKLNSITDKFTINCTFSDSEGHYTEVTTKDINKIFIEAERIFKMPVMSFTFIDIKDNKVYFNPNYVKKDIFIQGELF